MPILIGLNIDDLGIVHGYPPIECCQYDIELYVVQLGAGFWFGNNMTYARSAMWQLRIKCRNSIFSATNNYSAAVGIALAALYCDFQNQAVDSKAAFLVAATRWYCLDVRLDILLIVIAGSLSLWALRICEATRIVTCHLTGGEMTVINDRKSKSTMQRWDKDAAQQLHAAPFFK